MKGKRRKRRSGRKRRLNRRKIKGSIRKQNKEKLFKEGAKKWKSEEKEERREERKEIMQILW